MAVTVDKYRSTLAEYVGRGINISSSMDLAWISAYVDGVREGLGNPEHTIPSPQIYEILQDLRRSKDKEVNPDLIFADKLKGTNNVDAAFLKTMWYAYKKGIADVNRTEK